VNLKTIGTALFCMFFNFDTRAQTAETFLITGSRLDSSTANAQTVLRREQISALNPSSTVDLLKKIPNIIVTESGQAGGLS
jgi:outer membrane cobalamin receptor